MFDCMQKISEFPYTTGTYCHRRRGHDGDHMEYPNKVKTKAGTVTVHDEWRCRNDPACCIHNPSAHKMRQWRMSFRPDKYYLVERLCLHDVGHPDPDSVMYFIRSRGAGMAYLWEHGCDGCCGD